MTKALIYKKNELVKPTNIYKIYSKILQKYFSSEYLFYVFIYNRPKILILYNENMYSQKIHTHTCLMLFDTGDTLKNLIILLKIKLLKKNVLNIHPSHTHAVQNI
jgi:hypothetical protein